MVRTVPVEKRITSQYGVDLVVETFKYLNDNLDKLKKDISEYTKVIEGYYPKGSKSKARCLDCCYRNICIK